MITFTTDYNTAEMQGSYLTSIYCIVRGQNENGVCESIGDRVSIQPPAYIENFDELTKEQIDAIVENNVQYEQLKQKIVNSIQAREEISTIKELPWNIKPEDPPPVINPVPEAVTPLQIRMAINMMGLREQVESYVQTLSQSEQDAWEYATVIERSNSVLVNGAIALGKTEQDIDDLFILANSLTI